MAAVNFSRQLIEKHIKLTPEVIEKISMMGATVEEIDKENITLEILPNRPDLLSASGFIRAFKSFLGKETGLTKYKLNKPEKNYQVIVDESVKEVRPFTTCAIVKGLKFSDESIKDIIELQEKLHATLGRNRKRVAIGIYPMEKIKLPIRYEAWKPEEIRFLPLESEREMNAREILVRHPTGKAYAHLMEKLKIYPVFVDSAGKILSIPPIINSHDTGKINEKTRDVFIECSGSSLDVLHKVLAIIVTTLADYGGEIYSMEVVYDKKSKIITPILESEKVKLSLENTNRLLGLNLKEKDIEKLLHKMGIEYSKGIALVPAWRADVLHEVDLIEDVGIAYGYENFEAEIPNISTSGQESLESIRRKKISDILTGLGLNETLSYHLIKVDEAEMHKIKGIELENAKTEYKILRPTLLIPALRILTENKDNDYPQKIFEIGTVFHKDSQTETGIRESEHLMISCSPAGFTELKQILDYLFNSLGKAYTLKDVCKNELIDGRTGAICLNGKAIGYIGECHPETLRNWGIKMPLAVIELNLDDLMQ